MSFAWYTGDTTYDTVLTFALLAIIPTAIAALFMKAPYGRFASNRFGASLDPRLGWWLMELPATISFAYFYATGPNRADVVPLVFMGVWIVHYSNRGWIFPALMRVATGKRQSFSLMVVVSGWLVTAVHGYLNGRYFSEHGGYTTAWLTDPRFLVGLVVYVASLAGNIHADSILRNLRSKEEVKRGDAPYRIPRGGLYGLVSCPSYLFELTAWSGFALMTWSVGALFVLGISMANLIPRAVQTHRWYQDKFDDYPPSRRALIPYLL